MSNVKHTNIKLDLFANTSTDKKPLITFMYFVPDLKKDGGKYVTVTGNVKKIDEYRNVLILENKTEIPISEIIDINENIVKNYIFDLQ